MLLNFKNTTYYPAIWLITNREERKQKGEEDGDGKKSGKEGSDTRDMKEIQWR